jgi:hypothetical protein
VRRSGRSGKAGRAARSLVTLLLCGVCTLLGAQSAVAAVYWGASDSIAAANFDGSALHWSLPTGANPPEYLSPGVCGVAVDGSHLFWKSQVDGSIHRSGLDGADPRTLVAADETNARCGLAVDTSHIYWTAEGGHSIARSNLEGGEIEPSFITGTEYACGVAVGGGHLYWSDLGHGTIGRSRLDGTGLESQLISESIDPCGVAVDGNHLYWADILANSIGRANLDGTEPSRSFIAAAGQPCGLAVSGGQIYWSNGDPREGGLGRANLDGSGANSRFIPLGTITCGVALDSRVLVPPSSAFSINRVFHNRRHGVLTLAVTVPSGGEIGLRGRGGLLWRQLGLPAYERSIVAQAGTIYLRISLLKGSALRKRLKRTGTVHDRLAISFRIHPIDATVWQPSELTTMQTRGIAFSVRRALRRPRG